jgi:iron(III) transport system permease protein
MLVISMPLIYIFIRLAGADADAWQRLLQVRLWILLRNTLLLVITVTAGSALLGVSAAWLTECSDLPGRKTMRYILAMPLAIPMYIGAIIHLALMRPRVGLIPGWFQNFFNLSIPNFYLLGFWGAAFVITLFSYPYIYLLSAAAFRTRNAALEEAARMLGRSPIQAFWNVTLPTLRPAVTAGVLLVALDVLAEYGTVALLRYETFTSAIFVQFSGRYDRSAATILSGVLVILAFGFLWAELRVQGKARFSQIENHWRPSQQVSLGKWRIPALLFIFGIVSASLLVPLVVLTFWSLQAFNDADTLAAVFRTGSLGFSSYVWNSLWSSLLAAVIAAGLSLPVSILSVRQPNPASRIVSRLCQVGYAVPGVVIALSLLFLVNRFLPFLYATPLVVVIAYVFRHMPQAVRSSESALTQVSVTLEEASRTLGHTALETFFRVTLPLSLPGLLSGAALVFLTSLKELPATLLLRPAGFDTLAVRIWVWASEGFYVHAAPAALVLVLLSILPLAFLLRRETIFQ